MIERIGRLNLEENEAPPSNQPRPSHIVSKWATKSLESVLSDDVVKTRTRRTRQEDGGDAYDLGDVEDIDISFGCELNLSSNFEPTSFEETNTNDEWK